MNRRNFLKTTFGAALGIGLGRLAPPQPMAAEPKTYSFDPATLPSATFTGDLYNGQTIYAWDGEGTIWKSEDFGSSISGPTWHKIELP